MENKGYYFIYTYGCQMNVHESEKLAGILEERGYCKTDDVKNADVVVFNTCCIRESAEQKIWGNIGAIKPIKAIKKDMIVAVCGCMSQQKNAETNLKRKFPFINIIFGANNIEFFGEYLDMFLNQKKYQAKVLQDENYMENPNFSTFARDDRLNAYVNIMFGCNNFCTYCIVPFVKGREKSRPPQDILKETEFLIKNGNYKKITLLGQNVNSYGNDFLDKSYNFSKLLADICKIDGDFEVSFMSSHPKDLSDELIDVIANNKKISRAIHLPVQSGSNKILKAMNRNYTREHYLELVDKIKTKIEDATLTTDIIVGFPTETEEDFLQTVDLVKKVNYTNAFIFMYSKRKGTLAEKMEGQIPIATKHERINRLLKIQKEISTKHFENMVGKTAKVLVDGMKENFYTSKTECGKVALINSTKKLEIGEYIFVKITDYKKGNLYATV